MAQSKAVYSPFEDDIHDFQTCEVVLPQSPDERKLRRALPDVCQAFDRFDLIARSAIAPHPFSTPLLFISTSNSSKLNGQQISVHCSFSLRIHPSQLPNPTTRKPNVSLSTSKTSHHSTTPGNFTPTSLAARYIAATARAGG